MEFAFRSFSDFKDMTRVKPYFLRVSGGKETGVNLVPAFNPESVTVPFIYGNSVEESSENVKVITTIPGYLKGEIIPGTEYGSVSFELDDYVLDTVPLVADRSVKKANIFVQLADTIVYSVISRK